MRCKVERFTPTAAESRRIETLGFPPRDFLTFFACFGVRFLDFPVPSFRASAPRRLCFFAMPFSPLSEKPWSGRALMILRGVVPLSNAASSIAFWPALCDLPLPTLVVFFCVRTSAI